MPEPVLIPKLGNTVEDVTIVEWLVNDGDEVTKGQEILEIETDKATFAVEAPADGFIHLGPFDSGDVTPVFTRVAIIGKKDEAFPENGPTAATHGEERAQKPSPSDQVSQMERSSGWRAISPRARRLAAQKGVNVAQLTASGPGGRIIERDVLAYLERRQGITPVARKMAEDADLDISALAGTGIGGRITKKDVARALAAQAERAPGRESRSTIRQAAAEVEALERKPLTGVRKIIAERMAKSVHTTARVTLVMEVDATELVMMRKRLKARVSEKWGFSPGYHDLLAFIAARALREFPYMNARLTNDAIEYLAHINLGVAVDTERGLVVPNIKDADQKSLRELGMEFRELVQQARSGRISPDSLRGGTFTITSLGSFDVDAFTPVINLPEAAILGVGRIAAKPVVRNGEIVARDMLTLSLVFDHRLVDGAPAARFLRALKEYIEEPYLLLGLA
ncbi:MAG: 2-oxo acid dehydrogenase subunit E2 [Chloroflexi bacterium]|nr:2-oxo acid dehydrogenase subunit E2 [Chloroflexota bacterium]